MLSLSHLGSRLPIMALPPLLALRMLISSRLVRPKSSRKSKIAFPVIGLPCSNRQNRLGKPIFERRTPTVACFAAVKLPQLRLSLSPLIGMKQEQSLTHQPSKDPG